MNDQQLKQFIYIAKFNNITKAANELYMSQQSLSQSIKRLEKELGAALFTRSQNGVTLTEVGRKILPQSEMLLEQIEEYSGYVQEQIETINAKTSILVEEKCLLTSIPTDLIVFAAKAHINIEAGSGLDECFNSLKDKTRNVAYCFRPTKLYGFSYIPVVRETPIVLLNEHQPLTAKEELTIADIVDECLLLPKFTYSSYTTSLAKAYATENSYPKYIFEASDIATLIQLVRADVGIKISPTYVLPCFSMDGIEVRPLIADGFLIEYGFLINSYDDLNASELHFINSMLEYYNTKLSIITEEK